MSIQILAEKGKREEVLEAAVTKHFKNFFIRHYSTDSGDSDNSRQINKNKSSTSLLLRLFICFCESSLCTSWLNLKMFYMFFVCACYISQ